MDSYWVHIALKLKDRTQPRISRLT